MRAAFIPVSLVLAAAALDGASARTPVTPDPIPGPIDPSDIAVELVDVAQAPRSSPEGPHALLNQLDHAGDGSGRLFVADSRGRILILEDGALLPTPFLDVAAVFDDDFIVSNQQGLRSFAFHPDFEISGESGLGLIYTALTLSEASADADVPVFVGPGPVQHHDVVVEWRVHADDPNRIDPTSARELLRIEQPLADHNIGQIGFSPNAGAGDPDFGLLYAGIGDGGNTAPVPDATRQGQDTTTLLGTIMRIDPLQDGAEPYRIPTDNPFVGDPDALPEIWAYGLRHPQFLSWDVGGDVDMVIADIGQANVEEVNLGRARANYGWSPREGTFMTDPDDHTRLFELPVDDHRFGFVYPVAQYDHDEGSAIAGGYVYRGSRVPELVGKYVFGDIVNGRIFCLNVEHVAMGRQAEIRELVILRNGEPIELLDLVGADRADLRFGQDENGELFVLTKQDGMIRTFASPD